jgi:predicted AlkP superfamily pyrophosphatase or phosphodiesterase
MIKKFFFTFLAVFLAFAGFTQQVQHVVLITIDGFRPDFYLDTAWHTPRLRELMKRGTYANGVNSVFPSMTYPSHTTIVTGVQPARHGVYFNGIFEPNGSTGKMYWNDTSIHVPTIWGVLHSKGLKVATLLWPVSADAPADYDIPDIGSMGETVRENYSKPAGLIAELKTEVFGGTNRIEYGKDQNIGRIAAWVIKKDQPSLMTIHFFSVDHAEHMQGRSGNMVSAAIRDADEAVGIVEDALKEQGIWDNTVLIVTGDHGFLNVTTNVFPNVWLKDAGLLTDVKKDDWKAQFYTVGGSAYLHLKDPNDQATVTEVKKVLLALPDSVRKFFRIIESARMKAIGGNPEVPLALSGENGASFGGAFSGEAIKPGRGGTHGYFPDFREIQTGFIIYGPGIRQGGVIPVMNLRDIAPVVAKILGFSFPSADGKIPSGLFVRQSSK